MENRQSMSATRLHWPSRGGYDRGRETVLASAVVWEDVVDIANLLAKLGHKRPDSYTFYFATRLASVLEFRNYCFITANQGCHSQASLSLLELASRWPVCRTK